MSCMDCKATSGEECKILIVNGNCSHKASPKQEVKSDEGHAPDIDIVNNY